MGRDQLSDSQVQGMARAASAALADARRWLKIINERREDHRHKLREVEICAARAHTAIELLVQQIALDIRRRSGETDSADDNG